MVTAKQLCLLVFVAPTLEGVWLGSQRAWRSVPPVERRSRLRAPPTTEARRLGSGSIPRDHRTAIVHRIKRFLSQPTLFSWF